MACPPTRHCTHPAAIGIHQSYHLMLQAHPLMLITDFHCCCRFMFAVQVKSLMELTWCRQCLPATSLRRLLCQALWA
jgi:hypothetical protein